MFGDHKSHRVGSLDAAHESLQTQIGECMTSGVLNPKQINGTIFEIKHAVFLCVQEKERLKKSVKSVFEQVRGALADRERALYGILEQNCQENIDKLASVEQKWTQKYEVALEVLYILESLEKKRISPKDVVLGAHSLHEKLELLKDEIKCEEVTALSGAAFVLNGPEEGSIGMTHEALLDGLKRFGHFPDAINISYKL
jgi:hypothetical protein